MSYRQSVFPTSKHRGHFVLPTMDRRPRSSVPSLLCAFMASLTTGGTTYGFSIYSDELKKSLGISQASLETLSTSFFMAGLLSWLPGMCADKFGTRLSLALGGVLGATSLISYWAVATQTIPVPPTLLVPVLSVLGICIFLSNSLTTGSVFKIIVASCGPGSKGAAVGAAKGFVGLGSGAYTCLFKAIRRKNGSDLDFLPMAAFFALACATLPSLFILPTPHALARDPITDDSTPLHFRLLYCSLVGMALLVTGNSLAELFEDTASDGGDAGTNGRGGSTKQLFVAFLLVACWLGPIVALYYVPRRRYGEIDGIEVVPTSSDDDEDILACESPGDNAHGPFSDSPASPREDSDQLNDPNGVERNDVNNYEDNLAPSDVHTDETDEMGLIRTTGNVNSEPANMTLMEMLKTPTALLMLWTTTVLVGAGTMETNNMSQMVESLQFPKDVNPASLALFSVAQAGTRVFTGSISEAALNWKIRSLGADSGVPRPMFLVVAAVVAVCAHGILSFATSELGFVLGSILSGAAFGMVWPLMVLITGEVFGAQNVGANYMFFDGFTSAMGTLVLSKLVTEAVYENNIPSSSSETCIGVRCFRASHIVVVVLSLTSVVTSLMTLRFSKHLYSGPRT